MSKVTFAMAAYGGIKNATVASYAAMLKHTLKTTDHEIETEWVFDGFICGARTALVEKAIENGSEYLLFLDADMIWPANMPDILIDFANKNPDVHAVSGNYCMRNKPHFPLIYMDHDEEEGKYQPVTPKAEDIGKAYQCKATGFGACLLRVSMFENISMPWFALENAGTEDIFFYKKANLEVADMKVAVLTNISCGHITNPCVIYPTAKLPHVEDSSFSETIYGDEYVREHFKVTERQCQAK